MPAVNHLGLIAGRPEISTSFTSGPPPGWVLHRQGRDDNISASAARGLRKATERSPQESKEQFPLASDPRQTLKPE
jgi:hypothetical protein